MDSTIANAAATVLTDLADKGGGTYEAKTLIPFRPESGYAVGVGGIHLPAHDTTVEAIEWALRAVAGEYSTSFVGTWLDKGIVYFDAVMYFRDFDSATLQGRLSGQQAIYDFANGEAVAL